MALITETQGGVRLSAVDQAAAAQGVTPGLRLTDARALVPHLKVMPENSAADARMLAKLADWAMRYTPWSATDGPDGLVLDITGCAHLFGGEDNVLRDLTAQLSKYSLTHRLALADTPAAAWAWARYGTGGLLATHDTIQAVRALPVAALRISGSDASDLARLGLRRIEHIADLPRAPLTARFGKTLLGRLDQILGRDAEPLTLQRPSTPYRSRIAFAEPIGRREDIKAALDHLLSDLCQRLEIESLGARELNFTAYSVDATAQHVHIGAAAPSRNAAHLAYLFQDRLDRIDPGFGLESFTLDALTPEHLAPKQMPLAGKRNATTGLMQLVDRLQARLGAGAIVELKPIDSHIPERAVMMTPAFTHCTKARAGDEWMADQPRPARLLPYPELIDVVAPVPDDPPLIFRWRKVSHRVARSEGPERIAPEWWQRKETSHVRDYYWLEDTDGRRFWVYRNGLFNADTPPRWYLHGLFA